MDPLDFHKVALHLVSKEGAGAAEFRTAISRSYYGTYHFCYKKINDIGFNLPRGSAAHGMVKNYLSRCGDFKLEVIAKKLGDLHSKRIKADYNLYSKDVENEKTVKGIVEQANRMISTINNRFNENSTIITEKIKEYRKKIGIDY